MSTFMAVQCYHCSTMQVKQKKKSSNRWTCVVCNEKQSVMKVFAHNSMAKHVRSFVQSFNMNRKCVDDDFAKSLHEDQTLGQQIPQPLLNLNDFGKRKSTDWTAYLDTDANDYTPVGEEEKEEEDTHGPKVVTELPTEMFKKPRLRSTGANASGRRLCKPNFPKRGAVSHSSRAVELETKSKNDDTIAAGCNGGSRWTVYLTQEEEEIDSNLNTQRRNCSIDIADTSDAFTVMDQQFEEDIHPDFQ